MFGVITQGYFFILLNDFHTILISKENSETTILAHMGHIVTYGVASRLKQIYFFSNFHQKPHKLTKFG